MSGAKRKADDSFFSSLSLGLGKTQPYALICFLCDSVAMVEQLLRLITYYLRTYTSSCMFLYIHLDKPPCHVDSFQIFAHSDRCCVSVINGIFIEILDAALMCLFSLERESLCKT